MNPIQESISTPSLIYVHDPMCSWCWGFRPALNALIDKIPSGFQVMHLVGGLAPDSDQPMPLEIQHYLQQTWMQIQETIPGTRFNFDFWEKCQPRRSTYPACRAVIAARKQGSEFDPKMTLGIQQAYYLEARNPSDNATLIEVAASIGLAVDQFEADLDSAQIQQTLCDEIDYTRSLGVQGFPSLLATHNGEATPIPVNITNPQPMLDLVLTWYQDKN